MTRLIAVVLVLATAAGTTAAQMVCTNYWVLQKGSCPVNGQYLIRMASGLVDWEWCCLKQSGCTCSYPTLPISTSDYCTATPSTSYDRAACDSCLSSCRGLPSCCSGMNCMCEHECQTTGVTCPKQCQMLTDCSNPYLPCKYSCRCPKTSNSALGPCFNAQYSTYYVSHWSTSSLSKEQWPDQYVMWVYGSSDCNNDTITGFSNGLKEGNNTDWDSPIMRSSVQASQVFLNGTSSFTWREYDTKNEAVLSVTGELNKCIFGGGIDTLSFRVSYGNMYYRNQTTQESSKEGSSVGSKDGPKDGDTSASSLMLLARGLPLIFLVALQQSLRLT